MSVALDHPALYSIGREHVERLARRVWNDYNVHDPGITTLELLCYALTDLGYRATLPIEDLLATREGNAEAMREQFVTARRILPNRALTMNDYRKLVIDVDGVRNAWIVPVPMSLDGDPATGEILDAGSGIPNAITFEIEGLYRAVVEYDTTDPDEVADIRERIVARLAANRTLCQHFVDVAAVAEQRFVLCAELELEPDADVSIVEAEILFRVGEYLAPTLVPHSLEEMLAPTDGRRPRTVEEIFDGPVLDNGFIDDDELERAALKSELRLSDVISVIMDIPGVRSVREAIISPEGGGALANRWVVPVIEGRRATLSRTTSRLVHYKRNVPVVAVAARRDAHLAELDAAVRAATDTDHAYDIEIPLGSWRDVGRYHSFQNHFPEVYGLGPSGTSPAEGEDRPALARQLKGYLLFFDQLMAGYVAQLESVRELFSTDPTLQRTYFHQVVDSFREFESIYLIDGAYDEAELAAAITEAIDDEAVQIERRNRFLDHLIARFAERFHELAAIMRSVFGTGDEAMIHAKCAFLRDYPETSGARALGYDASLRDEASLWNTTNVSGLERRIGRLLGIGDIRRRSLSDALDIYAELDETPGDEFRFRVRHRVSGRILLSSTTNYATPADAREEMRRAIMFASLPGGYERRLTVNDRHYFVIVDETGEVLARRMQSFETTEEMEAEIAATMQYLRERYSEEGMFLIENILLRPQPGDPRFTFCPDPNCDDCEDLDPYSNRIHVVLPAYAGRFEEMEFRTWVEQTIREETPAHILPKICWISRDDMIELEGAYRDWLRLVSGADASDRAAKLERLHAILRTMKSVYPKERLRGCDAPEGAGKFILGSTALGTIDE